MKKTLVSVLLVLVLLTAAVAPAFAVTTYYVKTKNGGPLIVREGPGKQYAKLGRLKYGATVGVDGYEGNWARIVWGSVDAYVWAGCLSATKPGKASSSVSSASYKNFVAADYTVRVTPSRTSGWVNMRWAPNTSSRVHAKYYLGDELRVIAETSKWVQVYDEEAGICGFMVKSFVQKVD